MKGISTILTFLLVFFAGSMFAQLKTPAPSPTCKLSQDVGLIKIDVEYSRPSAKGRKVFGDLVAFDEMWRVGANASTKVNFSGEVSVGGVTLPAKQYALFATPGRTEWTIIFYKNTTVSAPPGKDFKEEDVAAKFTVVPQATKEFTETFTINVANLTSKSADIELVWENTRVVIPVKIDTDKAVLADIKTQLEGPTAGTYYAAGRYYFEEKIDNNKALEWVNVAIEKGGEKFWMLQMKAKILAALGKHKEAIEAAERSTKLAIEADNKDYPRANEKLIAEWKTKK